MIYTIEQLQLLAQSELVKAPPFDYEELLIVTEANVSSPQPQKQQAPKKSNGEEDDNDSDGSSDSHLDELTSRYFLQRGNLLNKKSSAEVALVPPKFAFASASPSVSSIGVPEKESRDPKTTRAVHVKESQQDSDGWISVGPKHAHGRRSFNGDAGHDRRKFLQGQTHRKKGLPKEGSNWRRRESKGADSKPEGGFQQFQGQQFQGQQFQGQQSQGQQSQGQHSQGQQTQSQFQRSPESKFTGLFSGQVQPATSVPLPPPGLDSRPPAPSGGPSGPPPGLMAPPLGVPPPFLLGPDGNPLPPPPFGNLPPPPPEFLKKFYNGEIPPPPGWN